MFKFLDFSSIHLIEALLTGGSVTIGISLFVGSGYKKRLRISYIMMFVGISLFFIFTLRMPNDLQPFALTLTILVLYIALFKESALDRVPVLIFAITPYYLLNPIFGNIFMLLHIPQNRGYIYAQLLTYLFYVMFKILMTVWNPKQKLTPVINITALVIANIMIYLVWFRTMQDSVIHGVRVAYAIQMPVILSALFLNLLLIINFVRTEANLEILKNYNEIKKTVSPLIEKNIALQQGFSKHLSSLKQFVDPGDIKATAYIDEVIRRIETENEFSKWQKPVVGALIVRKKQEAKEKGIELKAFSNGVDDSVPIPDYIFVSILSTIIDCAFHWIETAAVENRTITLIIQNTKGVLISTSGGTIMQNEPPSKDVLALRKKCARRMRELRRLIVKAKGRTEKVVTRDGFKFDILF